MKKHPAKIIGVQFSMLSPEEIRKTSVVEVTSHDTFVNNKPCVGGLFDPRMGTIERDFICPTDMLTYMDTPGYFGHLELARPVFYTQHMKEIQKILRCVCFKCSKLLIDKEDHSHVLNWLAEDRWKYVYNLAYKVKRCSDQNRDGCGCKKFDKIKTDNMNVLFAVWELKKSAAASAAALAAGNTTANGPIQMRLTPEIVLKIFKRISDDDIHFMGFHPVFARPQNMICEVLAVPPPAVRPSVKHDANQRSEDDLTQIYSFIIKTNNKLKEQIRNNAAAHVIDSYTSFLQHYIASIASNKVKGATGPITQRTGRPLQCISSRLNSKSGRVRGNLMGKRVDYSARSVITADPNISIRELGVPMKIAKNLTKPVKVNDRNRDFLLKLVQNGPDIYPGAKSLDKINGNNISLRFVDRLSITLQNGDIVNRHLMDGDCVLFNRQPSLHRMSMLGHIVKVMKQGDTFRLNLAVTRSYNADFDGDEMNMHMPQNAAAEVELQHLAAVSEQIVSPSTNAPITGIFQDSLLGAYRMTRLGVSFTQREAMNMLMKCANVDAEKLHSLDKKVTSFDLLSQIVPPLTIKYKTKLWDDGNNEDPKTSNNILEIRNGKWIRGQIDKGVFGSGTKGIVHRVHNDFGNMACSNFIDDLQNIVTHYMTTSSYSVGIGDLIADAATHGLIKGTIAGQKNEVQQLLDRVHLGIFENNTATSNNTELENQVNKILNKAAEEAGKIGRKNLDPENRFVTIVKCGSKGSPLNIAQMISCLGQQNVDGKRIQYGFDSRTLPHFHKFDDSPEARGFVDNSYIQGLTPTQLFFHAMGGRIGLIDTAVKSVTWETPIVILDHGKPIYIEIGRWIDGQLDTLPMDVEHYKDRNLELLHTNSVFIPTTDDDGIVSWGEITAITRHDPGEHLYEIKTAGGRNVTVTESKSLIVWNPEKQQFLEKLTPDIQIGDNLPVTLSLPPPPIIKRFAVNELGEEIFQLDTKMGIFIGLYIAAGKSHGYKVSISHNNSEILAFVREWFTLHEIHQTEKKNSSNNQTIITCESVKLAHFLTSWVPSDAFIGSDEFIIGILNGYFSADGIVSRIKSIKSGIAANRTEIDGIALLCSRLGIFAEIVSISTEANILSINSQWVKIFGEKINLLDTKKDAMIKTMTRSDELESGDKSGNKYSTHNDVVLDPIIEINIIGVEKHPKMYDLTIPSTLNFGLANGLQVRDTSSTGYIQRKLVKGLEDLKVEYDMTVRNNRGKIVQFHYGEDNIDSTRIENQQLGLVKMSLEDIYLHYDVLNQDHVSTLYTTDTAKRFRSQKEATKDKCALYVERMIQYRNRVVRNVFGGKDEDQIKSPVAFQYVIANLQGQLKLNANTMLDITPLEAFQLIEDNYAKLRKLGYAEPTLLFEVMYYFALSPREIVIVKRFHKTALILLLEHINLAYKRALVQPGEMVGVVAGQSTGEPITQLTLNSLIHAAEIVVRDSKMKVVKQTIGDFTEKQIQLSKKIDYMKDKDTTYAELSEFYEVPCATESGETVWRRIEAVTQHPVINEDGTNTMLKVTTKGNREVTATKAKSFLQLIDGKIQAVEGKELKVGDYLPCSRKPLEYTETFTYNTRELLPPNKYLYGTELEKAKNLRGEHHWWKNHANKSFILPHSSSQSLSGLFNETPQKGKTPNKAQYILPGNVYMKSMGCCRYNIPETIELNYEFGYLLGAYAAEGSLNDHTIGICNNDDEYLKPIEELCNKWNIPNSKQVRLNRGGEGWTSQELKIDNTILRNIVLHFCGRLSDKKKISSKIVFSNRECILGFLDAYIGGDGSVAMHKNENGTERISAIHCWSCSRDLLTDVMVMLKNLGVSSSIYKIPVRKENGREIQNKKTAYSLDVKNGQSKKLAALLNIRIKEKQDRLQQLLGQEYFKYEYCLADMTIPNIVNGELIMEERNGRMMDLEFDQIVSIEEVANPSKYAYDLTVEDTRNFDSYCGTCFHDTFHSAGNASKSNVTRGVPRIDEIIRITDTPASRSLTIYLKPEEEQNMEKATQYTHMLEYTRLSDVVKSVQICFDPTDSASETQPDHAWLQQYYEFDKLVTDCATKGGEGVVNEEDGKTPPPAVKPKSKWVLRLEMDAESMLDKNIEMDDVHFAITNYNRDLACAFTDYNSDSLIFRIRMDAEFFNSKKKGSGSKNDTSNSLDQTDQIYLLTAFQETLLNSVVLRGVSGISAVTVRKVQDTSVYEDGKYVRRDKWVLDTTGTNLMHVLALEYIDYKKTISNDIREVWRVLGVEACRNLIYTEIQDVMEFSGAYVNSHHVHLLADRMTATKNLMPIYRTDIMTDNIGPIAKATFEMHTEVMLNAARHGSFDHMRGVSANVMMGQNGYYGTSAFQLVLDMNAISKLQASEEDNIKEKRAAAAAAVAAAADVDNFHSVDGNNNVVLNGMANNIEHLTPLKLGCAAAELNTYIDGDVGI